jgi:dCMP deaminase
MNKMTVNLSDKWIKYGLNEAKLIARQSKDPSTQVGAAIMRPNKTIASKGYNGFPRQIEDKPELYLDREEKYKRVIHAEMNAILDATERLDGYILFTWPFLTCERCAVHVIQSGISSVIAPDVSEEHKKRWNGSLTLALDLYEEAGVAVFLTKPVSPEELKSQSPLAQLLK